MAPNEIFTQRYKVTHLESEHVRDGEPARYLVTLREVERCGQRLTGEQLAGEIALVVEEYRFKQFVLGEVVELVVLRAIDLWRGGSKKPMPATTVPPELEPDDTYAPPTPYVAELLRRQQRTREGATGQTRALTDLAASEFTWWTFTSGAASVTHAFFENPARPHESVCGRLGSRGKCHPGVRVPRLRCESCEHWVRRLQGEQPPAATPARGTIMGETIASEIDREVLGEPGEG